LVPGLYGWNTEFEELADVALRGLDPAGSGIPDEEANMQSE
jgi:hypothetical protein